MSICIIVVGHCALRNLHLALPLLGNISDKTSILGWTTRQQFEETWMCMLSVLCTPLDNVDLTDINIARRASTLAMKAITDQLLQTLRYPVLGNKNVSKLIHVSRNRQFPDTTIR
ncbi:hypothetical protein YQE_12544, partial [Dendroctonus ponderosae]